tara:strand:+ start:98 stop:424 length:327 start_codon:yes stop_codon:yes gene_type:complete
MAEVIGKLIVKNDTQDVSEKFSKREFVVETSEQYPQKIIIQFVQDKCDLLNNYNIGDIVEVGVNLQGREWIDPQGQVKYFNTIQAWKINKQDTAPQTQQAPPEAAPFS